MSWSWMDDSHPLRSMSIGCPIPEIRLFQTLTLKLQGQGHGCGQRARSYNGPSILLTRFFSFHINQTNNPWNTAISKFDLETSKVRVMWSKIKVTYHTQYPTDALPFCFTSMGPEIWPKYCLTLKKHIRNFIRKFVKIIVSNKTSPKFSQVITMTREIKLPRFVVIGWVVLTLLCRQANLW